MVKLSKGRKSSGPSSTMGIMRFFDSGSQNPKISPQFAMLIATAFTGIILLLKILG